MKARTVGCDRGVGDEVRGRLSQIARVSTTGLQLLLALKWEAALAALMLQRLWAYHSLPSDTVVVSGVLLQEVIFKMMKEGFMSVFDNHIVHLMYSQQINSIVNCRNIHLSLVLCSFFLFSSHYTVHLTVIICANEKACKCD